MRPFLLPEGMACGLRGHRNKRNPPAWIRWTTIGSRPPFIAGEPHMGIIAIATYRPKTGQEQAFLKLLKTHMPILRKQKLVTRRQAYAMRSDNGTIIEVFEWVSEQAKLNAHKNAAVMACWNQFFALADIVSLGSLDESKSPFAGFERIDF
jgi:quinol monooxygenase YgiN